MNRILLAAAVFFAAAPAIAESPQSKPATHAPVAAPAPAPSSKMTGEAQRLDLNSATVEQLSSVKGLNKSLAEAIVKARPFKSVDDLTARQILSSDVFGSVKDQLIIR
jgi:competence protein ComEA